MGIGERMVRTELGLRWWKGAITILTAWYACLDITGQDWPSIPATLSGLPRQFTGKNRTNCPLVCPDCISQRRLPILLQCNVQRILDTEGREDPWSARFESQRSFSNLQFQSRNVS